MPIIKTMVATCDYDEGCSAAETLDPDSLQFYRGLYELGWGIGTEVNAEDRLKIYCPEHHTIMTTRRQ